MYILYKSLENKGLSTQPSLGNTPLVSCRALTTFSCELGHLCVFLPLTRDFLKGKGHIPGLSVSSTQGQGLRRCSKKSDK